MRDAVAKHRVTYAFQCALGGELRTVDADDDELARKSVLETAQRLQRLQTIDVGIGPEVQNDESATQLRQRQLTIHVQPRDAGRIEVRRANRRGAAHGVWVPVHSASLARAHG